MPLGQPVAHSQPTGLPCWLSGRESACDAGDAGSIPWVRKTPWRRKWQPTPVFLPGKSHGQRSLVGYRPWGRKEWTRLSGSVTAAVAEAPASRPG